MDDQKGRRKRQWQKVKIEDDFFQGDGEGFYCLEELTDYKEEDINILRDTGFVDDEVNSQPKRKKRRKQKKEDLEEPLKEKTDENPIETEDMKVKKKEKKKARKKKKQKKSSDVNLTNTVPPSDTVQSNTELDTSTNEDGNDLSAKSEVMMDDWLGLGVPEAILAALKELNFTSPTAIQRAVLPASIFYRQDIIGAAETGSGKTLAFSIPIISHILRLQNESMKGGKSETAADASEEKTVSENVDHNSGKVISKPLYALVLAPTRELAIQVRDHILKAIKFTKLRCVALVGGLASAKQQRLLQKCPEIVVGTPGRLYKLLSDGDEHLSKVRALKYLVIDEVDRMLEHGHFKDLESILELIQEAGGKRQCFLFSATVTIPQYHKNWKKKKQGDKKSEIQTLVDKIGLDSKAKVVDLTTKHVAAEHLKQKRVVCNEKEKDLYLYYFLLTHPGRTLVFVNSIGSSRRLCAILTVLGLVPLQLHAGKQQRQRLKALDRFKERESGLLVATDVAARGLDIPLIKNVVHYHLPKDPKMYIHRSGRTARAAREGLSVVLEGPSDVDAYKRICQLMKTEEELEAFSVDIQYFPGLKKRIELAYKIDKAEHKVSKSSSEKNWYKKTANEVGTDERDFHFEDEDERGIKRMDLKVLKKQMNYLLKLPLIPKGFSGAYPTKYGGLLQPGLPVAE